MKQSLGVRLLAIVALSAGVLPAQKSDSTAVDSIIVVEPWTRRLVLALRDTPKAELLHHPWDVWGHSDIATTLDNPFIPADLIIGATRLDGGLGQPILSSAFPLATDRLFLFGREAQEAAAGGTVRFVPAPLDGGDPSSQTFLFWDQGSYRFRDVQVGGAVNMAPGRRLLLAGQGMSHPGRAGLDGPGAGFSVRENVALENYLIDYRMIGSGKLDLGYTLFHQQEATGLPYVSDAGQLVADLRTSWTWSQGLVLSGGTGALEWRLHTAAMAARLITSQQDSAQVYLNRRTLTTWAGGQFAYRLPLEFTIRGSGELKGRTLRDWELSRDSRVAALNARLGLERRWRRTILYAGLALADRSPGAEAALRLVSAHWTLHLASRWEAYLDWPHTGRRANPDSLVLISKPGLLRRLQAAWSWARDGLAFSTQANLLTAGDGRHALTAGGYGGWVSRGDVVRLEGSFALLQTADASLPPMRINGWGELSLTLPLKKARARPFASISASLISHDFNTWLDPRYADLALLVPAAEDARSLIVWVAAEWGIKVSRFELRYGRINLNEVSIQNSVEYRAPAPLTHFSISWRFLPSVI